MERYQKLDAVAVPLDSSNIDTDQILPARYLQKPRANDFGDYLFKDVRHDSQGQKQPDFPLNQAIYANAKIILAGANFGCGSSREHAVWALYDGQFRAVIAPSFGDIFYNNALKNGLLPIRLSSAVVSKWMLDLKASPGEHVQVDLSAQNVLGPDGLQVHFELDSFSKHCLLEGVDELGYTLGLLAQIRTFERTNFPAS